MKFIILSLVLTVVLHAKSMPEQPPLPHTGFGGAIIKFTPLNNQYSLLTGLRASYLLHSTFAVGLEAYTLATPVEADMPPGQDISLSYGGLSIDYIFRPFELVHGGLTFLVGQGVIDLKEGPASTGNTDFYILEPGWFFQGNVTTWFQIDLGVGYRYIHSDVEPINSNWDISHLTSTIMLKFGKFKTDY